MLKKRKRVRVNLKKEKKKKKNNLRCSSLTLKNSKLKERVGPTMAVQ